MNIIHTLIMLAVFIAAYLLLFWLWCKFTDWVFDHTQSTDQTNAACQADIDSCEVEQDT